VLVLQRDDDGEALIRDGDAPALLFRVTRAVPAGATHRAWRRAVRETLDAAIADGDVATGMTDDGAYVVRRA